MLSSIQNLINLSQSQSIIRRYFVVNGFDGALTMLGLIIGFMLSKDVNIGSVINVCLGAAIALCVSGISSAYVSESAERKFSLRQLENSMLSDLSDSSHGQAAKYVPILVGLVNGLAPLLISLLIITPLWLHEIGITWISAPLWVSLFVASLLLFALGLILSRVADIPWYLSGLKTLGIGVCTAVLIYLFVGAS